MKGILEMCAFLAFPSSLLPHFLGVTTFTVFLRILLVLVSLKIGFLTYLSLLDNR